MSTPKDVSIHDCSIDCHSWDPDDHGGGFPAIEVSGTIYDEKSLDKVIKALEKRRKWLAWQNRRLRGEK